jgi:WD40 repeat protein
VARAAGDLLHEVRAIPLTGVEGRIDHMSMTPDGRLLFIAALGNNSIEIVDTGSGAIVHEINQIESPQGVLYLPDSQRLAVASGGDGNVRIYDGDLKLLGVIRNLPDADNVRYDARARLLYVGYGAGAIAVIDPRRLSKVADIPLDGHPESFRLESTHNRIFVNVPREAEVEVVDRAARKVIAKWPLTGARSNYPMALDEAHHRLLIGCRKPSKLLVLNTDNGTPVASLDCVADADDLFYDGASKRIFISGGGGAITVIGQKDPDDYRRLGDVKTAPGARTSYFAGEERLLYVAVPHRDAQRAEIRVYKEAE